MNIQIVCVGTIKEKYYSDALAEYLKRISRFHNIQVIEVAEAKAPKHLHDSDINKIKETESNNLQKYLKGYVVLLDIGGNMLDSVQFCDFINQVKVSHSTITFVIGGSYGVSDVFKKCANYKLSFSRFTFPHQLMRVILVEQIYRATTIDNNITYHK